MFWPLLIGGAAGAALGRASASASAAPSGHDAVAFRTTDKRFLVFRVDTPAGDYAVAVEETFRSGGGIEISGEPKVRSVPFADYMREHPEVGELRRLVRKVVR